MGDPIAAADAKMLVAAVAWDAGKGGVVVSLIGPESVSLSLTVPPGQPPRARSGAAPHPSSSD